MNEICELDQEENQILNNDLLYIINDICRIDNFIIKLCLYGIKSTFKLYTY